MGAIAIIHSESPKATRELSPLAGHAASWFRKLARGLKVCRLYKTDNAVVVQAREQVLGGLEKLIADNGGLALRFTPSEIYVNDEVAVRPKSRSSREESAHSSGEEQLPFLFYRDGIRGMRFPLGVPREQLEALFDALKSVGASSVTHDDLVTLLWQANLTHIQIDSVPLEQTIYVSAQANSGRDYVASENTQKVTVSSAGAEIHANLGQSAGSQGLHRDTFDDWELADTYLEVPHAFDSMLPTMEYSLAHFRAAWEEESTQDWSTQVAAVLAQVHALDPTEETRAVLVHSVVSWVMSSLQNSAIEETQRALEMLRTLDPDRLLSENELATALAQIDHEGLVEYLNEAEPEEQARFAALAVSLGKPAVDLTYSLLSKASSSRTRAAACTALSYQCADDPHLLAPYLGDAQGETMVDLVFTLGQIGGPAVVDLLRLASRHPESRVRRQVVLALGGVPAPIRIPLLIEGLDTTDLHLLTATLQILTREKSSQIAHAILARICDPGFEARDEDSRWTLFNALGEVADDDVVPALAQLVTKGGWLARRTFTRSAAARTLQRIGTDKAYAVLTAGLRSKSPVIRRACRDVMKDQSPL